MSGGFLSWLTDPGPLEALLAKATVLLALAWAADLALRRANPRWRVLLWRGAAVGLAALPVLMLALPALRVELAAAPSPTFAASSQTGGGIPLLAAGAAAQIASAVRLTAQEGGGFLAVLWAAGLALLVARTLVGHRRLRRLMVSSRPVPDAVVRRFRTVAAALRCRAAIELRAVADLGSPLLVGLGEPVVLLPDHLTGCADGRDLDGIAAHELAHVCSRDLAWAYVLHWMAVLLWFHPLAWRMGRAHSAACELVCDAVSARYVGGRTYARTLARVALSGAAYRQVWAGAAMAGPSELARRLEALARAPRAAAVPVGWVVGLCLVALLAVIGLSAVVFVPGRDGIVQTEYGPASRQVAERLGRNVTLKPPYAAVPAGAGAGMISVQQAVILITQQVGLGFNWGASYPGAYPGSTVLIRPEFHDVPCELALRQVLEAGGLDFGISNGAIVLRPAAASGAETARAAP